MPFEITVKLNNQLLLTSNTVGFGQFSVPENYLREAVIYHRLTQLQSEELPKDLISSHRFGKVWGQFLDWLTNHNLTPTYLFGYNPIELPNRLWVGSNSVLPNLYNCFTVLLPTGATPQKAFEMLDELEPLLPHQTTGRGQFLLEYAYLKGNSEATEMPKPSQTGGNQNYFNTMKIPVPANDRGVGPTLTIVELNGWELEHGQLRIPPKPTLLFPKSLGKASTSPPINFLTEGKVLPNHGNKILGVLKAQDTFRDTIDLCKGIVPRATIRLCSCTVGLEIDEEIIQSQRYDEPNAVLAALVDTKPGDVLLIEVGAGGQKFPLESQPAVFDLFKIAYARHVTVVEAAGNSEPATYIGNQLEAENLTVRNSAPPKKGAKSSRRTYWQPSQNFNSRYKRLYANVIKQNFTSPEDFISHYLQSTSHAILVGSTDGGTKKRSSSSWGERVQVYAQGVNITTITANRSFGITQETSGAAAIIAGVVMSLQGVAHAKKGFIEPAKMLALLQLKGTPILHKSKMVGRQPNYEIAVGQLEENPADWITPFFP